MSKQLNDRSVAQQTTPREVRLGLVYGIIVYAAFGVVDRFMLPVNYKTAWILRFFILVPPMILIVYLSFKQKFYNNIRIWLTLLIILGQMGIISMMFLADKNEIGYYDYYMGMTLVMMWGAFVFRLSIKQMILIVLFSIFIYNAMAIFYQKLSSFGSDSAEFAYLVNNNFVLISSALLALVGSVLLNRFGKNLFDQNKILELEKTELEKAKLKAEESDRLKMAFLSNMSHEIRTPMNSIIGFAEMLKNPNITELKEKKYINIIQSKGKHLLQLINDIIDIARIEANELAIEQAPVNLNKLLDELDASFREMLDKEDKGKYIELKCTKMLEDDGSVIETDAYRLRQILMNLISNAIKFTQKGEVEFGYMQPKDGKLVLYTRDTGIGISEDKQKVIFERFRQADDDHTRLFGGIGLGLAIVKNLVGLIKGELTLESEVGKGSIFYVKIPYIQNMINETKTETIKENDNWSGKKILIAEDDPENFTLLEEYFSITEVKIIWAKSGLEAIEKFDMLNTIDLVLMDVKMPDMDGYDALRHIKKSKPNVPVIAQTAYALKEDNERMLMEGFDAVFTKPLDLPKMKELLRKYLT